VKFNDFAAIAPPCCRLQEREEQIFIEIINSLFLSFHGFNVSMAA
jgi:hypothetical protein